MDEQSPVTSSVWYRMKVGHERASLSECLRRAFENCQTSLPSRASWLRSVLTGSAGLTGRELLRPPTVDFCGMLKCFSEILHVIACVSS